MHAIDDAHGTEEHGRQSSEEDAQQHWDRPLVGKVGCDLELEGVVGVIRGQHAGNVHALHHRGRHSSRGAG